MPTYIYQVTSGDGRSGERFEVVQGMRDEPLTVHPQTGEPVRRVITGGTGVLGQPVRRSTVVDKSLAAATPCGCSRTALQEMARPASRGPRTTAGTCRNHGGAPHSH
ncbi:MAG: hypothetical protein F4053_15125 [Proteobacteria bacterium]|nr:hypothetical protein [Pseudomonadota bacterium]MYJ96856.1 hypothetical protein [Pseudomonadota bacterium]